MTWHTDMTAAPRGNRLESHRHDQALLHASEALLRDRKEYVSITGLELAIDTYLENMRLDRPTAAPKRVALTRSQKDLLDFIKTYVDQNEGVSPSYDEMKDALDLASKSGIYRLITALEERGFIRRLPNRARSIAVEAGA